MNDEQNLTDLEQAKAKLQEVQETKQARASGTREPQAGELIRQPSPRLSSGGDKGIKPITKKPLKRKFSDKLKEAMFGEALRQGNGSIGDYLFFKLFVPTVKRLLGDMANSAINMALGLDPKTRTIGTTHTANASLYRDRNYSRTTAYGEAANGRRTALSDLEWDKETANDIYNQIADILDRYPNISIAEVYSIMDQPQAIRTTDKNWGWDSLRGIDIVPADPLEDRWYIDFPRPVPLR